MSTCVNRQSLHTSDSAACVLLYEVCVCISLYMHMNVLSLVLCVYVVAMVALQCSNMIGRTRRRTARSRRKAERKQFSLRERGKHEDIALMHALKEAITTVDKFQGGLDLHTPPLTHTHSLLLLLPILPSLPLSLPPHTLHPPPCDFSGWRWVCEHDGWGHSVCVCVCVSVCVSPSHPPSPSHSPTSHTHLTHLHPSLVTSVGGDECVRVGTHNVCVYV